MLLEECYKERRETMIIKQNKWQTILYAMITLIAAVMLFWFAFCDVRNRPHDYNFWIDNAVFYWILRGVSLVCGIFAAAGDVYLFKQMFSKAPLVEICDEYFYDNSSAISLGRIAWEDMESAWIFGGFLNIKLKNPESYFSKKNWIQMRLIKANLKRGYGDVCISPQRFKKNGEKFIDEFKKRKPLY